MEQQFKKGHPILAVVLGLLAVTASIFLIPISGVIGGGIALILGILALVLGIKSRKGGRGIPGILIGIVTIVMSVLLTVSTINALVALREEAKRQKPDSLVAQYMDKPYLGLMGVISSLPEDQATMEQFMAELEAFEASAATESSN